MLKVLLELDVLDVELEGGLALPVVVFKVIADAEGLAAVDAREEVALLEGDTREHVALVVALLTHGKL